MFITRATRHDQADRVEFFESHEWDYHKGDLKEVAFIARDGGIVGNVTLLEVDPQTLIVEDVVVEEKRRGEGIGRKLMQAAMNSRGGKLFLCTHPEEVGFYEKLGFADVPFDELPERIQELMIADDAAPHQLAEGHVHHFMTAR